jgi:hypothetical protein
MQIADFASSSVDNANPVELQDFPPGLSDFGPRLKNRGVPGSSPDLAMLGAGFPHVCWIL